MAGATDYGISIPAQGASWYVWANSNAGGNSGLGAFDELFELLRNRNLTTYTALATSDGTAVTTNSTGYAIKAVNGGAGYDFLGTDQSAFLRIVSGEISNSGNIELLPTGATTGNGVKLQISSLGGNDAVWFRTGLTTGGFYFEQKIRCQNMGISTTGTVNEMTAETDTNIAIKGGTSTGRQIRLYPAYDSASSVTEGIAIKRSSATQVRIDAFEDDDTTNLCTLQLNGTTTYVTDAGVLYTASPVITGTISGAALTLSGSMTVGGNVDVTTGILEVDDLALANGLVSQSGADFSVLVAGGDLILGSDNNVLKLHPDTDEAAEYLTIVRNGTSGVELRNNAGGTNYLSLNPTGGTYALRIYPGTGADGVKLQGIGTTDALYLQSDNNYIDSSDNMVIGGNLTVNGGLTVVGATNDYGEMYQAATAQARTLATNATWTRFMTFSAGVLSGVTFDATDDALVIAETGKYQVTYTLSARTAGTNEDYRFGVIKNGTFNGSDEVTAGTVSAKSIQKRTFSGSTSTGSVSGSFIMDLTAADVLNFVTYQETAGTDTLTVDYMNVSIHKE